MTKHFKPKFSKQEVEWLKSQIFISDIQDKILDGKLKDKSLTEIALEVGCDERTISRHYKILVEKIKEVI